MHNAKIQSQGVAKMFVSFELGKLAKTSSNRVSSHRLKLTTQKIAPNVVISLMRCRLF
jgi:hypothetical protein